MVAHHVSLNCYVGRRPLSEGKHTGEAERELSLLARQNLTDHLSCVYCQVTYDPAAFLVVAHIG
ncbi:hypothetical protein D3C78_1105130 [compost metagenome]